MLANKPGANHGNPARPALLALAPSSEERRSLGEESHRRQLSELRWCWRVALIFNMLRGGKFFF